MIEPGYAYLLSQNFKLRLAVVLGCTTDGWMARITMTRHGVYDYCDNLWECAVILEDEWDPLTADSCFRPDYARVVPQAEIERTPGEWVLEPVGEDELRRLQEGVIGTEYASDDVIDIVRKQIQS